MGFRVRRYRDQTARVADRCVAKISELRRHGFLDFETKKRIKTMLRLRHGYSESRLIVSRSCDRLACKTAARKVEHRPGNPRFSRMGPLDRVRSHVFYAS